MYNVIFLRNVLLLFTLTLQCVTP